ncbi:hypothetical protein, partial [Streptomyces sp. NPDC005143]
GAIVVERVFGELSQSRIGWSLYGSGCRTPAALLSAGAHFSPLPEIAVMDFLEATVLIAALNEWLQAGSLNGAACHAETGWMGSSMRA